MGRPQHSHPIRFQIFCIRGTLWWKKKKKKKKLAISDWKILNKRTWSWKRMEDWSLLQPYTIAQKDARELWLLTSSIHCMGLLVPLIMKESIIIWTQSCTVLMRCPLRPMGRGTLTLSSPSSSAVDGNEGSSKQLPPVLGLQWPSGPFIFSSCSWKASGSQLSALHNTIKRLILMILDRIGV